MNPEYYNAWFVNSFQIQVLCFELVYCWKLPRKRYFWPKLIVFGALFLLCSRILFRGLFSPLMSIGWVPLSFPVITLLSAGLIGLLYHIVPKQMLFYGCLSLTMQHLVHCSSRLVRLFTDFFWWQTSEVIFLILLLLLSWFYLRDRFCDSETAAMKGPFVLSFASLSIVTTCVISYGTANLETETIGYYLYDMGFCITQIMIILEVFQKTKSERDQIIMMHLLKQEQEQNQLSRETVDIINRKCHDLKHQISALRTMSGREREASIQALENAVLLYENFVRSGNKDLDIILAEKNLIAEQKGILLLCMVDGKQLDFLKTEDLYSLLGNALDNAIESAENEKNAEKRVIELRVMAKGIFISVHVTNPCAIQPEFVDGLPQTTKKDTVYHGFGMRSMRYIAEQYHGALTASWEDGVYSLDMVFPRKAM